MTTGHYHDCRRARSFAVTAYSPLAKARGGLSAPVPRTDRHFASRDAAPVAVAAAAADSARFSHRLARETIARRPKTRFACAVFRLCRCNPAGVLARPARSRVVFERSDESDQSAVRSGADR